MTAVPDCFKAYDVRGRVPEELNEDFVYQIGRAYVVFTAAKTVAVGHDIRLSSPVLADALIRGLQDQGADVVDIGMGGTEEVYFATFSLGLDGGIMVTASHNPKDYNGLKFVKQDARPISGDTGLQEIAALAVSGVFPESASKGRREVRDLRAEYVNFLLKQVEIDQFKPLKIVTNAGNGGAGLVLDVLENYFPFEFVKLQNDPDGSFPNGVPNPLLEENRAVTAEAVVAHGADLGIAWDGDFDRCFFFDEKGGFVEGYYIVGLIAEAILSRMPGETIVYDPRLTWNTLDVVASGGGKAIKSQSGHAFMKQVMRDVDAAYGGEMSAHHYFREFAYCDNGHLPWLFVAALISLQEKPLSELVANRQASFPVSGEINRKLDNPDEAICAALDKYADDNPVVDRLDGIGLEFETWRFNLRKSNTEPLIRLNVESKADVALMEQKTSELLKLLERY